MNIPEINETDPLVFQITESAAVYQVHLRKRIFDFAVEVIQFLKAVPYTK